MRILVTGKKGQVVTAVRARVESSPQHECICLGRPELDLTRPDEVRAQIIDHRPDVVINAAAWTDVDAAETAVEEAYQINAAGAASVAAAAQACQAPILHLSTDYVFSGEQEAPYREVDDPDPRTVYGASKWAGEERVAKANPRHVILRTAWIYSATGKNFLKTMLKLAEDREEINVVADQRGTPTPAAAVADGLLEIIETLHSEETTAEHYGVFHLTAAGQTNWATFADAIFTVSGERGGPVSRVRPIPTTAFPTSAKRPKNSVLDCRKIQQVYGVRLDNWSSYLEQTVQAVLVAAEGGRDRLWTTL